MGRRDFGSPGMLAVVLMLALGSRAEAAGTCLRSPQVVFHSAALQGYLTAADGGIDVLTDQVDLQTFTSPGNGNSDFTLVNLLAGSAGNQVGVYNTNDPSSAPTLYQLFPAAALPGWYVYCQFRASGSMTVALYDGNAVYQGQTTYTGVDRAHFGFYVLGSSGVFYSQDARNGGHAQALSYLGTGVNLGDLWECFEAAPYAPASSTFTSCVLDIYATYPSWWGSGSCATPVRTSTWGSLKAMYR